MSTDLLTEVHRRRAIKVFETMNPDCLSAFAKLIGALRDC